MATIPLYHNDRSKTVLQSPREISDPIHSLLTPLKSAESNRRRTTWQVRAAASVFQEPPTESSNSRCRREMQTIAGWSIGLIF